MSRDNLSLLFNPAATPPIKANETNEAVANNGITPTHNSSTSAMNDGGSKSEQCNNAVINRGDIKKSGRDLLVGFSDSDMPAAAAPSAPPATPNVTIDTPNNTSQTQQRPPIEYTKPGGETIQYFKRFGQRRWNGLESTVGMALRELQLAEKLNALNVENDQMQNEKEVERMRRQLEEQDREKHVVSEGRDELMDQSEKLARELQNKEDEEECERIKMEADLACPRFRWRYDALVKFASSCPHGTYEEFVEFLLMGGGGTSENDSGEDDYNSLLYENFYDEKSEYRKLWNDNLTAGLPEHVNSRAFVPALGSPSNNGGWRSPSTEGKQRQRTSSEDERIRNFGQTLRDRTLSEGERIKNQIAQVDKQKIKRSAVNVLSNVSSFLKPLRDLQLAEKLNAMNIDMEEEEARKEIGKYNRIQEEKRDLEEMMRLKKEAEESCMNATKEHLLSFIKDNPDAKYHQWIEDFHPENAHDGTLLEGLGKTIDHRFYVEESDHRHLWNNHLFTFLDREVSEGRDYVPARAKQIDDDGEMVVAVDILSGSVVGGEEVTARESKDAAARGSDLIVFD
ncbi:hypothetical protein ACHAXR_004717 [Thalassiosira sp. AJA248-18]